jgi:hypothetical protein
VRTGARAGQGNRSASKEELRRLEKTRMNARAGNENVIKLDRIETEELRKIRIDFE